MVEIALPDGLVFLLLCIDRLRIERRTRIFAIFDDKMLGRMASLLEGFGDDQGDRLAPIADRARFLLRSLVGRALRGAGGHCRIVDHRNNAGHR